MRTEIIFILDRSGSMSSIHSSVVAGTNQFINDQREVPGEARFTLVEFNESVEVRRQGVPLGQVPVMGHFDFRPSGWTALYDAIGSTLETQGARIAREGWADNVIVAIMTDGQENRSRRYRAENIHSMISHAEEHGWSFVFLGANINVEEYADRLGISRLNAYSFTANAAGTAQAYGQMSTRTAQLRGVTY